MVHAPEIHSAEQFSERQFYDFLNGSANHELKLLTGGVILAHPDVAFSAPALRRTLWDRQGDESPAWKFQASIPGSYCEQSLEPSGAIVKMQIQGEQGKSVTIYQAEPTNRKARLACTGALLGWSLEYLDMSVQQNLGASTSHTQIQSPEMRYRIYTALLSGQEFTTPSMFASLEGQGYANRESMSFQLARMQELGLIATNSTVGQNPEIVIKYTSSDALTLGSEDMAAETRATSAAIKQIGQGQTTTVNDIITKALEINPTLDAAHVRFKLLRGINLKRYPGLERVTAADPRRTVIALTPEARKPITDLHERLEAVRAGDYSAEETAKQIIDNPAAFRKLVAKARSFSYVASSRTNGRQLLETQLAGIVAAHNGVTAKEARDALKAQHDRDISSHALRGILTNMVRQGKLTSDCTVKKQHSKRTTIVFKAAGQ